MIHFLLSFLMVSSVYANGRDDDWRDYFIKLIHEYDAHTFSGVTKERDFKKDSINVLVWNVKKTEERGWKEEFSSYGKAKDLFLLQEAIQNKLFTSTLDTFENFRWDMGIGFLLSKDEDIATGNMIGANVEPSYVRVRHTIDTEPVVRTPKATIFSKYRIEGSRKELLVISIHGINLTDLDSFKRHLLQISIELESHDGPVLFAGDFNTRTKSRTQYLEAYAKNYGLRPVVFENGHCRMRFKFTPYYLDHSYIRDLEVKKAWVDCNSKGSDHKPMLLELAAKD